MDNKINGKDLEFVNGGINRSEEAISGAIGSLQKAVATCAQLQVLSTFFEPKISGCIQRLQSCNGNFEVIGKVISELSSIRVYIIDLRDELPFYEERLICGNVNFSLTTAINLLS